MKISKRKVAFLFVLTLLIASFVLVQVTVEQPDVAYIEPPEIYTSVCENFTITVVANVTMAIEFFDFQLSWSPPHTMSVVNVATAPPWVLEMFHVDPTFVSVSGRTNPAVGPGIIPLAEITFHCDALGTSNLTFDHMHVDPIGPIPCQGAVVHQWYFKASYQDYAPSGVPDFDQKQLGWNATGWWTWCAPTAVANSLWWMDSRFENSTTPPPNINETFPLLSNYTAGIDDHDPANVVPFINYLAYLMDTDGLRTSIIHRGTYTWDMETGIAQYLSWRGVNPLGDVNGDGIVNWTDWKIVNASFGSMVVGGVPVGPWNMSADIWPGTVTGPYTADNIVDIDDLILVSANMNSTGQFYERTMYKPDFSEVEEKVEKSEDVILALGFWYYNNVTEEWIRAEYPETPYDQLGLGHAVTVAGINSTAPQIAISDPGIDAFEAGSTPGHSPVPHLYPHNSSIHNNASLVSHDIYNVTFIAGNPGGTWALQGYVGNPQAGAPPGSVAVVEAAVITSPIPYVAITNVTLGKTVVAQNHTVPINVTVTNQGLSTEAFNVTTYYNATVPFEGFEDGTFADWDFHYSTNGLQSGSIMAGTWSSSIVSGASALSGTYSARLFASSTFDVSPYRVNAAINRTINRNGATDLKATFKFDQITDPGTGPGHAFFYISVRNALNVSESFTYGFDNCTTLTPGDISFNVSPGDLVNFERDVAADYFNKYGKALPQEVMILLLTSADYAGPFGQTIEVRLDDFTFVGPNTLIKTKTVTLAGGNSTVITFTWDTTGLYKGNYTISAVADILQGETDTADNTYIDGTVILTILGDVNGDGKVDTSDLSNLSKAYGSAPSKPNWNPNCDLNDDHKVDASDLFDLSKNY